MNRPTLVFAALLAASSAVAQDADATDPAGDAVAPVEDAPAEDVAEGPTRPGAEPGEFSLGDDLAECAGLLAAMSRASTSFVERDNLLTASGFWTAAAVGATDGGEEAAFAAAAESTETWAGKIFSLRAMDSHAAWLGHCGEIGAAQGLDSAFFSAFAPAATDPASSPAEETEAAATDAADVTDAAETETADVAEAADTPAATAEAEQPTAEPRPLDGYVADVATLTPASEPAAPAYGEDPAPAAREAAPDAPLDGYVSDSYVDPVAATLPNEG